MLLFDKMDLKREAFLKPFLVLGIEISVFTLISLAPLSAWAGATRGELVPGSRYTSARMAALGDSAVSLSDNISTGLFYTPAGLGKVKDWTAEPINMGLQINSEYFARINTKGFYNVTNLTEYSHTLGRFNEYAPGVSGAFLPAFGGNGFGAGLMLHERIWAYSNTTNRTIRYKSLYQLIPAAGYGANLGNGILRVGYVLQWVNQSSGDVTISQSANDKGYNQGLSEGGGFSHNLGMAVTLPYTYLPQLDIVARNVGSLSFSKTSLYKFSKNPSTTPLAPEPMSIDLAAAYVNKTGAGGAFNWTFAYRDITDTVGVPLIGRIAVGMEFQFRSVFFLRGGWGSGFPNAGLGIRQEKADISFAWFGEDIGSTYHEITDRKYMLQYIIKAF